MIDVFAVLCGKNDGINRDGLPIFVTHRHLTLGIGPQPAQRAALANLRLAFDQTVGIGNREGHQDIGFVAGITEHQALVTGSLISIQALALVHALGDIDRLFVQGDHHRAARVVKAHLRGVVSNVLDGVPHGLCQINLRVARDFSSDDGEPGVDHRFAGNS